MRTILIRATLAALGVGVGLAIAETTLRLAGLAPAGGLHTVSADDFNRIPGLWEPEQRLVVRQIPALPYQVSINSMGFRGPEIPTTKLPGEKRVVLVGDSFTFGEYVDDHETLPAQLELDLDSTCSGITVVNAGVGGTTIVTHEQMILRSLTLHPDLIVLIFSENDVDDMASPLWYGLAENRAWKSRFPLRYIYKGLRELALWNVALDARGKLSAMRRPAPEVTSSEPRDGASQPQGGLDTATPRRRTAYAGALTAVHDTLDRNGVPFLYAVYPSHWTLRNPNAESALLDWAVATARQDSIYTVDFRLPLMESGVPVDPLFLLPHDGHPSARAYEIVSKALAMVVRDHLLCGTGS